MGLRAAIAIAAATAAAWTLAVAGSAPRAPRLAAANPAANGLSWHPPRGWHGVRRRLVRDGEPSLAAATFPVPRRRPASICDPRAIPRLLPPDGALLLMRESRWAAGVRSRLRSYPPRPRHVRMPRRSVPLECVGVARTVAFRDQERGLSATLWLGSRAPRSRLREAEQLLDSLQVERVPPPHREPWELWPLRTTEAGDSVHLPPDWTSGVLDVPRRIHRPRLLFYAATEPVPGWKRGRRERLGRPRAPAPRGVVVWVTEHERGPASDRYPSLRGDPFTDRDSYRPWPQVDAGTNRSGARAAAADSGATHSWRARGAWRGYRFSVTITAGEDAAPEDVERAYQSAASVALSGGLRDCSRAAQQRRPDLCAGAR